MDTQRGILIHCMGGWRAAFCVLDNLVPHREIPGTDDPEDDISNAAEGTRGFRWACRLHHWAGNVGYRDG